MSAALVVQLVQHTDLTKKTSSCACMRTTLPIPFSTLGVPMKDAPTGVFDCPSVAIGQELLGCVTSCRRSCCTMPMAMAAPVSYQTAVGITSMDPPGTPSFRLEASTVAVYVSLVIVSFATLTALGDFAVGRGPITTSLTVAPATIQTPAPLKSPAPLLPRLNFDATRKASADAAQEAPAAVPVAVVAAMAPVVGPALQGRTAALPPPAAMFAMLCLSLYAAWLGFQWQRTRTIGQV